jgi:hypothetical protein
MKIVRRISSSCFYISRILATLYVSVGIYALLAIAFYESSIYRDLMAINNPRFEIFYPGTKEVFLLGDYTLEFLFPVFGIIFLYSCFFWFLSGVFNAFRRTPLFTQNAVNWLNNFWVFNVGCSSVIIILTAFVAVESTAIMFAALHFLLGIFTFFMATIFKEGLTLQVQQEYTI